MYLSLYLLSGEINILQFLGYINYLLILQHVSSIVVN